MAALAVIAVAGGVSSGGQQSWIGSPDGGLAMVVKSESVSVTNHSLIPRKIETQDGDPYLKLEYKTPEGEWVRAQSHRYSWCGNSYFNNPTLMQGDTLEFRRYRPKGGQEALLRYRLYDQDFELVSNEFQGYVDLDEVARARLDSMAIADGELAPVLPIALGAHVVEPLDHINPRERALDRLAELAKSDENAVQGLRRVAALPASHVEKSNNEYYKPVPYPEKAKAHLKELGYTE